MSWTWSWKSGCICSTCLATGCWCIVLPSHFEVGILAVMHGILATPKSMTQLSSFLFSFFLLFASSVPFNSKKWWPLAFNLYLGVHFFLWCQMMESFFRIPVYENCKPGSHFTCAIPVSCDAHRFLAWVPPSVRDQLPATLMWGLQSTFPASPCRRHPVQSRAKAPHAPELCSSWTRIR